MRKVFIVLCLIAIAAVNMPVIAMASTTELTQERHVPFDPLWSNVSMTNAQLSFNNSGRATMSGMVIGNVGTERITVNVALDRVNASGATTRVATWNNISVSARRFDLRKKL